MGKGPLVPSFTLRRDPSGVIRITAEDLQHGPSTAERRAVLNVFALPAVVNDGVDMPSGKHVDQKKTLQPGTEDHFDSVAHMLPLPFYLMPGGRS